MNGLPVPKGLGYIVGTAEMGIASAFGWLGNGGLAFADPARGFAFAYLPNLLTYGPVDGAYQVADAIRAELGLEGRTIQALRRWARGRVFRRLRTRVPKRRAAAGPRQ
ncbi:hypothetical protein [Actinomadura sp. BRA 177]|uniref:hypothetical protein n=1 Tax=Actinomadura sp. BRA 177 TaxID=2745202 RepID=UPI0020CDC332|nr:hypothetical protein [Actinomadura sp. BRA 177]